MEPHPIVFADIRIKAKGFIVAQSILPFLQTDRGIQGNCMS
jgi:hypothetical protein